MRDDGFPIEASPVGDLDPPLRAEVRRIEGESPPRADPLLVHLLGVPGAGKSTVAALLAERLGDPPPTVVAFDRLMESVPRYRAAADREEAFARWELPARDAGYALLRVLLARGASVVVDHSGAAPGHVEMLEYARAVRNHRIAVVPVRASAETAAARVARRHAAGGRFVPGHYIAERGAVVERLLPAYRRVADVFVEIGNESDLGSLAAECDRAARAIVRPDPG